MTRTYKRKTNRGIGGKYTVENLCDAIKSVYPDLSFIMWQSEPKNKNSQYY